MHFFFMASGRARPNYLWLPGFIFVDPKMQLLIGEKVKAAFKDRHG